MFNHILQLNSPGPPAEKEPPPPRRNCSTVTPVLPFTSFQPPGYSNASMACVKSEGLYCLRHKSRVGQRVSQL